MSMPALGARVTVSFHGEPIAAVVTGRYPETGILETRSDVGNRYTFRLAHGFWQEVRWNPGTARWRLVKTHPFKLETPL